MCAFPDPLFPHFSLLSLGSKMPTVTTNQVHANTIITI